MPNSLFYYPLSLFKAMLIRVKITVFIAIFAMFITISSCFYLHQYLGYTRLLNIVINTNVDNFSA